MTLSQLQDKIGRWHKSVFDPSTPNLSDLIVNKIQEECGEFLECHDAGHNRVSEELADVMIACMAYAAHKGIDLESEIMKKHCVNLKRQWKYDGKKFIREGK